jgi:hypothetical protein
MAIATEVRAPAPEPTPPAPASEPRGRIGSWLRAPLRAPAETWVGAFVVLACTAFVFAQLHPDLLLAKTTPAGGDMGAHVWGPAYLRDHLLPHWRLTGWTPDWYAGFPAFQFYMLPPALLIVLLNVVLPYGVAMKLVTVLGVVALPLCAYVMGRLFRLPFPGPPLLAVATVPFLFDRTWTIYGGNIPSTLAGEYSFSISLSLALLFFGVLARGLETGRYRALAAALLALVILCHAIPAFFAMLGGVVLVLMRLDRRRLVYAAPIFVVGALLTAFWSIPFVLRRGLLTDMGWEKLEKYQAELMPQGVRWVLVLAMVGIVLSLVFWIRMGAFFAVVGAACAAGFVFDAAGMFHIWNARLLPFYYLSLYLLAAIGLSEVLRSLAVIVDARVEWRRRLAESIGAVVVLAAGLVLVALPLRVLPGGKVHNEVGGDGAYHWLFLSTHDDSFIDSWAKWNYEGYERKASYPEYRNILLTMEEVGAEHGCGRAHWEYESDLNRYGTPMAMMLLPFWTDGCIGSMEGLYFESSGTTPFHFLNASETSEAPSNPVRDLPDRPMAYPGFDLDKGVRHLQMMGTKYYMAFSPKAIEAADRHPDLTEVAESAPWKVYEVAGAELVEPLENEPAVLEGMSETNPAWQRDAVAWYTDPSALDVFLAPDGPKGWQRVERGEVPERRPLPKTKVSNIVEGDLAISFDVDRVGEPILVKTSYFPNWKVSGADRIYHVTPNLMVVIPTDEHVRLSYGYTPVDQLGYGLTAVALLGLLYLAVRGRMQFPEPAPPEDDEDGWNPSSLPSEGSDEAREGDEEPVPVSAPVGFWDSLLAERKAELAEADERASDPPSDRGPSGPPLLDPNRDLGDDEPGPLRP